MSKIIFIKMWISIYNITNFTIFSIKIIFDNSLFIYYDYYYHFYGPIYFFL
jgi:hypothetical protein